MKMWQSYGTCLAVGILVAVSSVTSHAYDLKYCYSLALEQDPQLRGIQYKDLATKETLRQAWARFFPLISFDIDFTQTYQDIVQSNNSVMPTGTTEYLSQSYTAQFTQPILHMDYFAQLSQAKTTQDRSTQEVEAARQDLIVRVTESYLTILAARDNITYLRAEESAVQMHYDYADGRYQRGLVPRTDLENAVAKLASIKADLVEAEKVLDSSIQALREIIGTPLTSVEELKKDIMFRPPDPDDVERWLGDGMKNNVVLKVKRFESEEAQKEISRQKAGHYPYVDLQSRWYRKDTGGSIYGGGSVVDTADVGIRMTFPLFSGGVVNSKVRESTANYQRLLQEVTKQERLVIRQIRDSFYGMKSSIGRVAALKKSVESQSLVLEAKEQGFTSGLYSSVEVLDAAKDLSLYQKNLSKAKYEYILNYLKLRQGSGELGDAEIELVNGWLASPDTRATSRPTS